MKELIRRNEIPREFNHARLREMFPSATITGDTYGFFYHVEATNTVFVNMGWVELYRKVKAHLKGNNIEVPINLSLIMHAAFCQYRPDLCLERDPEQEKKVSAWQMMNRFFQSAVVPYLNGSLVGQEEADRRAAICAACPMNKDRVTEFCVSCATRGLVSAANQFLTSKHTPSDPALNHCGVCQCDLKMKVWCPKEPMDEPEYRSQWPEHCWMR